MKNSFFSIVGFIALSTAAVGSGELLLSDKKNDLCCALEADLATLREKVGGECTNVHTSCASYEKYKKEIQDRSFYSWNFHAEDFDGRLSIVNGIFQEFIPLAKQIDSQLKDLGKIACTKDNYRTFIPLFDGILFGLREHQTVVFKKTKNPNGIWQRINQLWNAMFYFRLYRNNMQDRPVNTYPDNISDQRRNEIQRTVNQGSHYYRQIEQNSSSPSGITNEGSQCYANATLQALRAIPQFSNKIQNFLASPKRSIRALTKSLNFSGGQQDAFDFFTRLIASPSSLIDSSSSLIPFNEAERREMQAEFKFFPIDSSVNQKDLGPQFENPVLENLVLIGEFEGIPSCLDKNEQLGNGSILRKKLVNYPNVLSICRNIFGDYDKCKKFELKPYFKLNQCEYMLQSVVTRIAKDVKWGHFVAIVRYGKRWFLMDDDKVTEGNFQEICKKALKLGSDGRAVEPRLLFYTKLKEE